MPQYFFDVKKGHRLVDPAGFECVDDQEAIAIARQIAMERRIEIVFVTKARLIAQLRELNRLRHRVMEAELNRAWKSRQSAARR
jgi:hypothetical protein